MEELKKLLEAQAKAFEEFKAANDARLKAIEERGSAPADVEQKVNDINARIESLGKEIRDVAMKAQRPVPGSDGGDPERREYHNRFLNGWIRHGDGTGLRTDRQASMTVGSDPSGGYLAGEEMEAGIDRLVTANVAMMRLADVRTIGAAVYKRRVRTSGIGYGWAGETETPSETTTPQYALLQFAPGTIWAEPQISSDLLEDSEFDIEAELNEALEEGFTEGIGQALITGDGVNKPRGITNYTPVANASYTWGKVGYIASGIAGALPADLDPFIDLQHALKTGYRPNAVWLTSDTVAAELRKYKDGEGNYLWQPSVQIGQPDRFLGKPMEYDDYMPSVAANSLSVAYGDFKRGYVVVNRRGMVMLRDPYTSKPWVKFYTTRRIGGGIKHYEAIKFMRMAAN